MPNPHSPFLRVALAFALAAGFFPAASSYAYALINLNTRVDYDYEAGTSVEVEKVLPETEAEATVSATSSSSVENEEALSAQTMNVNRSQSGAELEASSTVAISPKAVSTNADLKAFALGALRSDASLDEVNFTPETVEVKYKEEGRLLALIPLTFIVKVVVEADGQVEVNYPWYSVMTVDKQSEMETQIKVAVDNALRARTVGSVRAEGEPAERHFTASEAAEVAAQIHAVLKGSRETGDN